MNKPAIAGAAVIAAVAVDIIVLNIRARRAQKNVVESTDQQIVETYNRITRTWEEVRDEINRNPTMERIDAILARYENN